jgi:hypothetical protein
MNRRRFWLLSGSSMLAAMGASRTARAQAVTTADPTLLTTTLTPLGAERAGNMAGTIPAWTGGFNTSPPGWNGDTDILQDFFASDPILYTVNSGNLSQHASVLSDGTKAMVQTFGMSLNVYQTRRTGCATQWVYDNTAANVKTAYLDAGGGRLGFHNAFGGTPFPIPDISNPETAGGQIFWNGFMRWQGEAWRIWSTSWTIEHGTVQLTGAAEESYAFPYYSKNGSLNSPLANESLDTHEILVGPSTDIGEEIMTRYSTTPYQVPNIAWELLPGQSRVRKTPELSYDTPSANADGVANYDEYNVYSGSPDEYDWKYIGKQEMLIPYNCQKVPKASIADAIQAKFLNPDVVRWELHRVWIIEATLHSGKRNVMARRLLYLDEDTWQFAIADNYDANGNLYHWNVNWVAVYPNMPGMYPVANTVNNMQTGDWTVLDSLFVHPLANRPIAFGPLPDSYFEPQAMAATASY